MRALTISGLMIIGVATAGRGQAVDTTVHDLADIADKPALLTRPDLGYKDCFRDAGLAGTDLVKFVIDTAGHVEPASVELAAVTDPILDTLAVRAVRAMTFRPGAVAGAHVRVSVSLPLHFGGSAALAPPEARVFAETCVDRKPQPLSDEAPQHGAPVGRVPADSMTVFPGDRSRPMGVPAMRVRVRFVVDGTGHVMEATVVDQGLATAVTQNATAVAKRMRFTPGRVNGIAVATSVTIPISVPSN